MKVKRQAEDFQVEEEISLFPGGGKHALYRLTKRSLGTLEAVAAIARHWKLPREAIGLAGLKDKHAETAQYVTIDGGPRRGLKQTNLALEYVGQVERPIHASDITGNRFRIVLRDLDLTAAEQAIQALQQVQTDGLPNYFDDQRFGSLGKSGEFIAKAWCLGDYERALWLAIAEEQAQAPRLERDVRQFVREHWGQWALCSQRLSRTPWDRVFRFLEQQPHDFRRAITQIPHDLRSLWLAAYQSALWNQALAAFIEQACGNDRLMRRTIGRVGLPFFLSLTGAEREQLSGCSLPLPSARLHLDDGWLRELYERVVASAGIELRQLRVKYPRDTFFSKGERPAVVRPKELAFETAEDELHPGRRQLQLEFTLPRGSYATILIKRIT